MQKIVVTGYNKTGETPVTLDEVFDAISEIGLTDIDVDIQELP